VCGFHSGKPVHSRQEVALFLLGLIGFSGKKNKFLEKKLIFSGKKLEFPGKKPKKPDGFLRRTRCEVRNFLLSSERISAVKRPDFSRGLRRGQKLILDSVCMPW
jgi:hypothetical protein